MAEPKPLSETIAALKEKPTVAEIKRLHALEFLFLRP